MGEDMTEVLLQVRQLTKYFQPGGFFQLRRSPLNRAVDGINFMVRRGEAFGLVGESGCGKSTAGRIILGLLPPTSGEVLFAGQKLEELKGSRKRQISRDIQGVFQDPLTSMNPRMTVEEVVTEPLAIRGMIMGTERRQRAGELLDQTGLPASTAGRYPHECSGGQRQRIALARALAVKPRFLVLDEPMSALDISVQAQMINLLKDLQKEYGLSYLLISHDLRTVRFLCDRVAVMYLGKIIESGPAEKLFEKPAHPYTRALLEAIPTIEGKAKKPPAAVSGEPGGTADHHLGCRFYPRCPKATALCLKKEPAVSEINSGYTVACHMVS